MLYQDITVVIASFYSSEKIFRCIESIDHNIKIIIIENSNDYILKDQISNRNSFKPINYKRFQKNLIKFNFIELNLISCLN